MIPRLHKRGTSFKGASAYLFHDKNRAATSERVSWVQSVNLWSQHPDEAWFEMLSTWNDRHALKQAAGVKASGRDNTQPVLHLSLAWHEKDAPSPEQMQKAALGALKALGLQEHQALMVAHCDEPQPHLHLLVNTVHPETGKTAKMTNSKLALSRWAEAHEREHGHEHCPERRRNNARRNELRQERTAERAREARAQREGKPSAPRKPYEPVKDRSPHRRAYLEKEEIVQKMRDLHADLKKSHKIEKSVLWDQQKAARLALENQTEAKVKAVIDAQRDQWRPLWKRIYQNQKAEKRYVSTVCTHPFERAAYVFQKRAELAGPGKTLTMRQMATLILSPKRLSKAVDAMHERQRDLVAGEQRTERKRMTDRVWISHRETFHQLAAKQAVERDALRLHQSGEREGVTFNRAKEELQAEQKAAEPFRDAAAPQQPEPPKKESRMERIARQTSEARARTGRGGGDFEREI
jgi:hypothetical protein